MNILIIGEIGNTDIEYLLKKNYTVTYYKNLYPQYVSEYKMIIFTEKSVDFDKLDKNFFNNIDEDVVIVSFDKKMLNLCEEKGIEFISLVKKEDITNARIVLNGYNETLKTLALTLKYLGFKVRVVVTKQIEKMDIHSFNIKTVYKDTLECQDELAKADIVYDIDNCQYTIVDYQEIVEDILNKLYIEFNRNSFTKILSQNKSYLKK